MIAAAVDRLRFAYPGLILQCFQLLAKITDAQIELLIQQPLFYFTGGANSALQLHVLMATLKLFDSTAKGVARQRHQIIHQPDLQIAGQQTVQRLADPGEVACGVKQGAAGDQYALPFGREHKAGASSLAQTKPQPGLQRRKMGADGRLIH